MSPETLVQAAEWCAAALGRARSAVLLSGAGMSTAAGIQDFRGPNGLYNSLGIDEPERIFDIATFLDDPSIFYSFHRAFLSAVEEVEPTFAHRFFAALEERGMLRGIITQNIDSLHQRAGSRNVVEIHGGIWKSFCTGCGREYDYETARTKTFDEDVPRCDDCSEVLKPDVVFFGEAVKAIGECQELAENADLLLVAGSSLVVTPAAILPALCPGEIVVVNLGEVSPAFLPPQRIRLRVDADIDTFFQRVNDELGVL